MSYMRSANQDISGQPLVSIVTIVLNGEKDIRQTMESVLGQSYKKVEYIVIDGGSTDNTIDILQQYDAQLTFWASRPDKGISDAFNKGIRQARGEIIGLLNAGDWYELDAVQYVVEAFRKEKEAGVVCGALQFWKGKNRAYLCRSVPRLLERDMTVTHPTCFVRAELYGHFGSFSEKYTLAMDYELLLRFKKNGVIFVTLDRVLANMRHDGVSEKNWQAALQETHSARKHMLENSIFATEFYYFYLVLKRRIRLGLERLGWEGVLRFYRHRIALVKKTK